MKCLVIGGGINGVLTAYFLQKKGYDVDIVDAENSIGTRATFANGCQLSFSHTTPMNIKPSFFSKPFYRPLFLQKNTKKWLELHENSSNFDGKFQKLSLLAQFSKNAFDEIYLENPNLPVGVGHKSGTIFIFSNKKLLEWRLKHFQTQNINFGVEYQHFDTNNLPEIDDSMMFCNNIAGGIFTNYDSTLDAHKFTNYIADVFQNRGGRIFFNQKVLNITRNEKRIVEIQTTDGNFSNYDEYIYCGGASGLRLLTGLLKDFSLNLQPVTGYSLTFDVSYSNHCPTRNIIDFTNKIVYSRHENKLRVAGFFDTTPPKNKQKRIDILHKTAIERFPILQKQNLIHSWHEERVFSPNEEPIVGKFLENFSINTAHGHLGVTLSAGSAKQIADTL